MVGPMSPEVPAQGDPSFALRINENHTVCLGFGNKASENVQSLS